MQVPTLPPPVVANTLPQDIASKAVPHTQAVAPLVQNAVEPTPKSEKFNSVRRDKGQKNKRGDDQNMPEEDQKEDDHSVNIRI
ncbi:MAG: hypothetical protein PHE27_08595 [Alphaproteobacteria bacterium]|nr:hypothetical protein [Alphaproteobacteria bacterium]